VIRAEKCSFNHLYLTSKNYGKTLELIFL